MGRIVTTQEVLDYGKLRADKLSEPQALEALIDSAEAYVERFCGRRFSPDPVLAADGSDTRSPVVKTFSITTTQVSVRVPDLRVATAVTLDGAGMSEGSSGYWLPTNSDEPSLRLYLSSTRTGYAARTGFASLQIAGRWGWLDAPEPVKQAIKALTMRMYRERDAAWADSVATPDGSVLSYFRQLPASIQGTLQMYKSGPKIALV